MNKSGFLVVRKKKALQDIENQLKQDPLMFCGGKMSQENFFQYLGD